MLTNPRSDRVKSVRGLSRRSVRSRTGQFRAEGPQAVREAVRCAPDDVRDIYVTPEAADRHADVVAAGEERLDEVRADEARPTGDEDPRHARSATTW